MSSLTIRPLFPLAPSSPPHPPSARREIQAGEMGWVSLRGQEKRWQEAATTWLPVPQSASSGALGLSFPSGKCRNSSSPGSLREVTFSDTEVQGATLPSSTLPGPAEHPGPGALLPRVVTRSAGRNHPHLQVVRMDRLFFKR